MIWICWRAQLQPIINELIAEGVNKIILQSHLQQIDNEQLLATKLTGVDIILSAGFEHPPRRRRRRAGRVSRARSDRRGPYPIVTQGLDGKTTLIVNTDGEYTYLGRLVVEFDTNGEIVLDSVTANQAINGAYASTEENVAEAWGTTVGNLATTAFADGTKGDKVEKLTGAVQAVINVKDGNVFGYTDVYLEGERGIIRNEETNLGDLSADANAYVAQQAAWRRTVPGLPQERRRYSRADRYRVATPIRSPARSTSCRPRRMRAPAKPEGGVSQLDVENSLRFDNKLMVYDTTPQGLLNILNWGAGLSANNGGFPQIGGVKYSFDPDLPGNSGSTPGSRIRDVALIDQDGNVVALVVDDGVVVADAPALIQVVTLNFTANGGDGYPVKANGDNFRYLLTDGTLSAPVSEALDFTAPANVPANALGEQQAFGDYMDAFHGTPATAYDQADTSQALDTRIQNLNVRDDAVFNSPADRRHRGRRRPRRHRRQRYARRSRRQRLPVRQRARRRSHRRAGDDTLVGGAGIDTMLAGRQRRLFRRQRQRQPRSRMSAKASIRSIRDEPAAVANVENLGPAGQRRFAGLWQRPRQLDLRQRRKQHPGRRCRNGRDVRRGGHDVYFVDNIGDGIVENVGEGNHDVVFATANFQLSANVEYLVLQGNANLQGSGNSLANVIYGNTGNNILDGAAGADAMYGGAGDDVYRVDGGDPWSKTPVKATTRFSRPPTWR